MGRGEEKKSINDFSACPESQSETTFPTHSLLPLPLPSHPTHPEGKGRRGDNLNSLLDPTERHAATNPNSNLLTNGYCSLSTIKRIDTGTRYHKSTGRNELQCSLLMQQQRRALQTISAWKAFYSVCQKMIKPYVLDIHEEDTRERERLKSLA